MKILFAGGGSLGPVTPLLAVAEELRRTDDGVRFVWAGTKNGPERMLVEGAGIKFHAIPVARLTRYASIEWLLFPFRVVGAILGAWFLLNRERPDLVASAGGFTGVPFVLLARYLKIPSWIHQPDVRPVLSNRICASSASLITVAWAETAAAFPADKTIVAGHPVRRSMLGGNAEAGRARFKLSATRPVVLVLGGGGGAQWINRAFDAGQERVRAVADVIHVAGRGKVSEGLRLAGNGYAVVELLGADLADAFAAATVVVARAGMGTLAELSALRKPCILVPLPGSQEENARAAGRREAAVVVRQSQGSSALIEATMGLLADDEKQRALSHRIGTLFAPDAAELIAGRLRELAD